MLLKIYIKNNKKFSSISVSCIKNELYIKTKTNYKLHQKRIISYIKNELYIKNVCKLIIYQS